MPAFLIPIIGLVGAFLIVMAAIELVAALNTSKPPPEAAPEHRPRRSPARLAGDGPYRGWPTASLDDPPDGRAKSMPALTDAE